VLGFARTAGGPQAFLWSQGTSPIWLALPDGARPFALGADRQVLFAYRPGKWLAGGILDDDGRPVPITIEDGDVLVRDINAAGVVTGIAAGGPRPARAFRWSEGEGLVELPVPDGFTHAHGNAIDSAGVVAGLSRNDTRDQATVWAPGADPVLLPDVDAQSPFTAALGVDGKGWVVGYEQATPDGFARARAVIWIDGVAWELDRLLLPFEGPEIHVTVAWAINDSGQIAARGVVDGVQRALRLDPQ